MHFGDMIIIFQCTLSSTQVSNTLLLLIEHNSPELVTQYVMSEFNPRPQATSQNVLFLCSPKSPARPLMTSVLETYKIGIVTWCTLDIYNYGGNRSAYEKNINWHFTWLLLRLLKHQSQATVLYHLSTIVHPFICSLFPSFACSLACSSFFHLFVRCLVRLSYHSLNQLIKYFSRKIKV